MRTVSQRVGPVVAMTAAIVIGGAGVAAGDSWHGADPRGDVTGHRYDPEPEPCGTDTELDASADNSTDITHLIVRHEKYAVVVVVRFNDLGWSRQQSTVIAIKTPTRAYTADVFRSRTDGTAEVYLFPSEPPPPPDPNDECGFVTTIEAGVGCRNLEGRIAPDHDLVSVRVPRRCIGYPTWVKGGARASRWLEDGAVHSDTWAPEGTEGTSWFGPVGPQVPRG